MWRLKTKRRNREFASFQTCSNPKILCVIDSPGHQCPLSLWISNKKTINKQKLDAEYTRSYYPNQTATKRHFKNAKPIQRVAVKSVGFGVHWPTFPQISARPRVISRAPSSWSMPSASPKLMRPKQRNLPRIQSMSKMLPQSSKNG